MYAVRLINQLSKNLLLSFAHVPSFDMLHALILLCWLEYKNNRIYGTHDYPSAEKYIYWQWLVGFQAYYQMVMKMAMDLGLSDQDASAIPSSEGDSNRRQSTWASIVCLHIMASQCICFFLASIWSLQSSIGILRLYCHTSVLFQSYNIPGPIWWHRIVFLLHGKERHIYGAFIINIQDEYISENIFW